MRNTHISSVPLEDMTPPPLPTPAPSSAPGLPAPVSRRVVSDAAVRAALRPAATPVRLPGDPAPAPTEAPTTVRHFLPGFQGRGHCLAGDTLQVWHPARQGWQSEPAAGRLRALAHGADRRLHALTTGGQLRCLDAEGRPADTFPALTLPEHTSLFAVAGGGGVAVVADGGENKGELGLITAESRGDAGRDAAKDVVWHKLPAAAVAAGGAQSIAFDLAGQVTMLDRGGKLWQGAWRKDQPMAWQEADNRLQLAQLPVAEQPSRKAPHVRSAVNSDREQLAGAADLPSAAGWGAANPLRLAVDGNTTRILDRLAGQIGLAGADPVPDAMRAAESDVRSPRNVLHLLHTARTSMFGAGDPLALRLEQFLARGVFLGHDDDKHWALEAKLGAPLHRVKNPYPTMTMKLMHDHALLTQALKPYPDGLSDEARARMADQRFNSLARLVDQGPEEGRWNPVTELLVAGHDGLLARETPGPLRLASVFTRPDGAVGAIDDRGNVLARALDGRWRRQDGNGPGVAELAFDHLQGGPRFGINAVGLAAPIPFGAQNSNRHKPWYVPSVAFRAYDGQDRGARYANWWGAHQPFQFTSGQFSQAGAPLHTQAGNNRARVADIASLEPLAGQQHWPAGNALQSEVDANTAKILDTLIDKIGIDDPGRVDKSMRATPDKVRSDDNVLFAVHRLRVKLFGAGDAQAQKLGRLLDAQVFLGFDSERHVTADMGDKMPLHLLKNRYGILTMKLLHDHALLARGAEAPSDPSPRPAMRELENRNRLESLARMVERESFSGELNHISQLFSSGFINVDRADKFLQAYGYLAAAVADPKHKAGRALRLEGALLKDQPLALAASIARMISEMEVGSTHILKLGSGGGIDLEGMSQFKKFRVMDVVTGIVSLQVAAIEPVNQLAGRRGYLLTTEKTADGVRISIGMESEFKFHPLAFKSQHGIGASKRFGDTVLFAYTGVNAKFLVGVNQARGNVATFTLGNDDHGKLVEVLTLLYGGELDPYRLMALSDQASNQRSATTTIGVNLDIEPLIAGGAVGSVGGDAFRNQLKVILGPLVAQINFELLMTRGRSTTQVSDGTLMREVIRKLEPAIRGTTIHVLEAQLANAADTPGIAENGAGAISHNIPNGYEDQQKLPVWIKVFQKQFVGRSVSDGGHTLTFDQDSKLQSMTKQVTARRFNSTKVTARIRGALGLRNEFFATRNVPQLRGLLESNPELAPYLDVLSKSGLTLSIGLKLKPRRLAELDGFMRAGGPDGAAPDDAALQRYIAGLEKEPANFAIERIDATDNNSYFSSWSTGVSLLRHQSNAESTLSRPVASIEVLPPARPGAAPALKVQGKVLLAPGAYADSAPLEYILHQGGIDLLDFLNHPLGDAADPGTLGPRVHRLMTALQTGRKTLARLEPGERAALAQVFPSDEGDLDERSLAVVLADDVYFEALQRSIAPPRSDVLPAVSLLPVAAAPTSTVGRLRRFAATRTNQPELAQPAEVDSTGQAGPGRAALARLDAVDAAYTQLEGASLLRRLLFGDNTRRAVRANYASLRTPEGQDAREALEQATLALEDLLVEEDKLARQLDDAEKEIDELQDQEDAGERLRLLKPLKEELQGKLDECAPRLASGAAGLQGVLALFDLGEQT
jgi:hypothetical protein